MTASRTSLPLLDSIRQDAQALFRPWVRRLQGKLRAIQNDLQGTAGTDKAQPEPVREQWARILRRSRDTLRALPPPRGPRILFALGHGFIDVRMCVETIVATALRLRGADVHYLACDKTLPACEINGYGNHAPPIPPESASNQSRLACLEKCQLCTDGITDPFRLLGCQEATYSRVVRPDDLARAQAIVEPLRYEDYRQFVFNGIHVGDHAYAAMLRATVRGTIPDTPHLRWLYGRFLASTIVVAELTKRILTQIRPDRVVAYQGIYTNQGTICEVARKSGVGVVVHGFPYRKGTIWFSHHDTYHRTLITEPTSLWEHLELTPTMAARVDEYLSAKRLGLPGSKQWDYAAYHADAVSERADIIRELNLDPNRPIVSLYSNILWDAQLFYQGNAFADMLEWMWETIRYFARRPDLQLVIRLHPAEGRGALTTRQPLAAEIAREFPVLPPNVRVVAPESRVSSYTLAEMSTAALIYGARMGVEIAVLGTPLIIAGESFNRRKGYSYDAESREGYFTLLDRLPNLPRNTPEMVRRARLYAYHFLYRLMIDLPLFSVADGFEFTNPRLTFKTLDDLAPGRCPGLDVICNGILDGKTPFIYDSLTDLGSLTATAPERGAA